MLNLCSLSDLIIFIFLVPPKAGLFIEIQKNMFEKKTVIFKSPDISKLTEVIIDHRTKIYVPFGTDVEEARNRYLFRNSVRRIK
jgi:hypothetical protein